MNLIYLKRLIHIFFGHEFKGSKLVDKLTSNKHPNSDWSFVYTVNIRECKCGLTFNSAGMESRKLTSEDIEKARVNINNNISYKEANNETIN